METISGIVYVSPGEIATMRSRQEIESEITKALRNAGVLIDPSDMRSPVTIAENMGILKIQLPDQQEAISGGQNSGPSKIKRMPGNGSFA